MDRKIKLCLFLLKLYKSEHGRCNLSQLQDCFRTLRNADKSSLTELRKLFLAKWFHYVCGMLTVASADYMHTFLKS